MTPNLRGQRHGKSAGIGGNRREIGAGADEDIYCILVTLFNFYLFDSSHFIRFLFTFPEEALVHQLLSKGSRA